MQISSEKIKNAITEYFADTFIQVNRAVAKESTQQKMWQKYTSTAKTTVYKGFCKLYNAKPCAKHFQHVFFFIFRGQSEYKQSETCTLTCSLSLTLSHTHTLTHKDRHWRHHKWDVFPKCLHIIILISKSRNKFLNLIILVHPWPPQFMMQPQSMQWLRCDTFLI